MTGNAGGRATDAVVGLDAANPLQVMADAIGETLGLAPEPGSTFAPSVHSAPEWSIEAGS